MRASFGTRDAARVINAAAVSYRAAMVGREFLYVFEGQFIEVIYRAKEFRHLTGVGTTLPANEFYRVAVRQQLTPNQLLFDARHPVDLCRQKMQHIQNLPAVVNSDVIILETIGTQTKSYEFGFTELNFTLCLDKDLDASGNPKSSYYIVQSLRDGDSFSRSGKQYECNYIFSKQTGQKLYDTMNYSDGKISMNDLPEAVKDKLEPALLAE